MTVTHHTHELAMKTTEDNTAKAHKSVLKLNEHANQTMLKQTEQENEALLKQMERSYFAIGSFE